MCQLETRPCRRRLSLRLLISSAMLALSSSIALASCLDRRVVSGSEIVAVGIHRASGEIVRGLRRAGNPAVFPDLRTIHLTGDAQGKAVVLVLTAYDETFWKIDSKLANRVKGIVLRGHHAQKVVGYTDRALVTSSFLGDGRGVRTCGATVALPYRGGPTLERLYQYTKTVIGKPISKFIGRYEADRIDIDEKMEPMVFPKGSIKFVPPTKPGPGLKLDLPKGYKAINFLLELGHIRPATIEDFLIWTHRATERFESGVLAAVEMPEPEWRNAFVAQTKVQMPKGLFGFGAYSLIVPAGVPEPEYSDSHFTYYYEKTGECKGLCLVFQ